MHAYRPLRLLALIVLAAGVSSCNADRTQPVLQTPFVLLLPTLGGAQAVATGISADGRIVVGVSIDDLGRERAFRWSDAGEILDLGTLGGEHGVANGISPDGAIIVGTALTASGEWRAFRWRTGIMEPLGTLGGPYSEALAATSSGVIVGVSSPLAGGLAAFRWTEFTGMEELGSLGLSAAVAVSADGSVIAGTTERLFDLLAFRWTEGTGVVTLQMPGLWLVSQAAAISADGTVIAGWASPPQGGRRAVRWRNGVMQELGTLNMRLEQATGISPEGDVVVGSSGSQAEGFSAFRWTEARGMENLNEVFAGELPEGWHMTNAYAVSSRGSRIAGLARSTTSPNEFRAFVLHTGGR